MKLPQLEKTQIRPPAPTRNHLSGMHVTEAGEGVLQTPCGEFDSHRLHNLKAKPHCGSFKTLNFNRN